MDSSSGAGKGSRFESLWESIPRQLSLRTVRRVEDNHRLMSSNSRSHFASQGIAHSNSRYLNYFCQYLETLPRCSALELVDRWIEKHSHFFIQEKYEEEDEEEEDINELAGEEMTDRKTHDLNDVGSGVHNKELAAPHLENGCLSGPKMVWARLRLCCHWESFSATANTVDELFFHVLQTHFRDTGKIFARNCVGGASGRVAPKMAPQSPLRVVTIYLRTLNSTVRT